MNSNRMKYASTPTYGMQKRNYPKKQAAAQTAPTPDFTQQPAADLTPPIAPFPAQNLFTMPQNAFPGAVSQPNGAPFFTNPQTMPSLMMPNAGQPTFNAVPPMNSYNGFGPGPQTSTQGMPLYSQPLGSSVPQSGGASFSPRAQGFVPPVYQQPNNSMAPNVTRSDPMGGLNGMPGAINGINGMNGMNAGMLGGNGMPGGMTGMPNVGGLQGGMGNPYGAAGFPQGGMMNNGAYGNQPFQPNGMNSPMGMNGYNRPAFPGMDGSPPAMPTPKPPFDLDKWLKIFLYGILPVIFIPCTFVSQGYDFLRYLFIILAVISLSVIWYRQSFTSGLRMMLSVLYLALSIVVIATLISGNNDAQNASDASLRGAAQGSPEPSATVIAAALTAQETPSPEEDLGQSEAEQRLSTFMDYWKGNKIEDMVNLVQPTWASGQDNAASALFTVISNRTPLDYTIESISGAATDSSRTVTMSSSIDKNNGKDPVRYRFMILMVKEGGEWYVDPNSLATNDAVENTATPEPGKETISQSLAPRMTVTPIPDPSTKLYYNANGGSYYHLDPNCSAVNPKYLPMASFLYSELDDAPYNALSPCLKCGAPTQSLGSLKETATPSVAP